MTYKLSLSAIILASATVLGLAAYGSGSSSPLASRINSAAVALQDPCCAPPPTCPPCDALGRPLPQPKPTVKDIHKH